MNEDHTSFSTNKSMNRQYFTHNLSTTHSLIDYKPQKIGIKN